MLKQINRNAPLGVKYSIEAVNKGLEASVAEGLLIEASLFADLCGDGRQEGRHVRFPRETRAAVSGTIVEAAARPNFDRILECLELRTVKES